jgi:predicted DCC family thiol-disulfide oxidoreductase YuxK
MSTETSDRSSFESKKIIIFDGECAFCNKSVLFIRKRNTKDNLWYCSSQSEVARQLLSNFQIEVSPQDSLIYIKNGKSYYYSDAPLEIAKELDHFWAMLSLFLIVPKVIRHGAYRFIAKRRKLIMGTTESCSLEASRLFIGRTLE